VGVRRGGVVSGGAIVDGRYVVISADCHAGADQMDYRPYLEPAWFDDFDAYPHAEGTHPFTPEALRWTFAGIDRAEVAAMLGGNAARVYGFDLDRLAPIAGRVGPGVEETSQRLDAPPAGSLSSAFTE
jgi:hypothetical protein